MIPTKHVVTLLLALQMVSAAYLWVVTSFGTLTAGRFAVFLAVDLLSFALVAYVYTHERWGETVDRVWILTGSAGLIILLLASLYFP